MMDDSPVRAGCAAWWAWTAAMTGWLAACTVAPADVPSVSGPSELALSLTLSATPEVLLQDGMSQSRVAMTARDVSARPVAGLAARADILVNGVPRAFGQLSARDLTTGTDGRATMVYTAPPPADGVAAETTVTIVLTPLTGDARSHFFRTVDIKLVTQMAAVAPRQRLAGTGDSRGSASAPFVAVPSEPGIPNSALRTPHSFRIPHSAVRIE